jgi:hypothetical protein
VSLRIAEIIPVLDLRDYQTYYYATKAFLAGENPYDLSALSAQAGKKIAYAFLYPKLILIPFIPLAQLPYQTSALLYIALKGLALGLLVVLWVRYFVADLLSTFLLGLFLVTAYHATVIRDYVVGNVSVFEQLFLWSGFLFLLQKRFMLFCIMIVAGSFFKVTSVAFLFLPLLFSREKKTVLLVATSLAALGLFYLVSYWDFPNGFEGLRLRYAQLQWEGSYLNPSSYAFIRQLVKDSGVPIHEVTGETWKIFAGYALLMLAASSVVLRKTKLWTNPSIILLVSVFLYALLLPRFKDYSYILLVLPSLVVLRDMVRSSVLQAALVLLVCLHLMDYQSFFAAFILFMVMLTRLSNISPTYSLIQRSS